MIVYLIHKAGDILEVHTTQGQVLRERKKYGLDRTVGIARREVEMFLE